MKAEFARGSTRTTFAARTNMFWFAIACGGNFVGEGEGLGEAESVGAGEAVSLGAGFPLGEASGAGVGSTTGAGSGVGVGASGATTGSTTGGITSSASDWPTKIALSAKTNAATHVRETFPCMPRRVFRLHYEHFSGRVITE